MKKKKIYNKKNIATLALTATILAQTIAPMAVYAQNEVGGGY